MNSKCKVKSEKGKSTPCVLTFFILPFSLFTSLGCHQKMADQPRYEPLEASRYFPDGRSTREPVQGALARDEEWENHHLITGKKPGTPPTGSKERPKPLLDHAGEYEAGFPVPLTPEIVERGRERYGIYCAVCHGRDGAGDGPVVAHGYPRAEDLHSERLRTAPAGYWFDVITHGQETMPLYAGQIPPRDRWAIIAFIRRE